ncbi:MAG: carbohydrate ABC transporter permease [Planctomycetota bacterium]
MSHDRKQIAVNWAFAVPALILMAMVNMLPVGEAIRRASGLDRVLDDAHLPGILWNTTLFTVASVAIELLLGLAVALILVRPFPGRGWVRAAVLIPWALPTAIMAMAWQWIFNSEYGVLGDLLFKCGLASTPRIPWLARADLAMFACILADVWKTTPFMALLILSSLSTIPRELYEAAAIDGAGPLRRFFVVTLPLIRPTLALAVIFRAIQAFGIFDLIWVLTGGGPGGKTRMLALYVYDNVFRYGDLGYGCTLTLVMAACLVLMSAGILLVARREPS